jgi:4-diphosphocytidyl-2C-methyl-D-erythritol kinase
MGELRFSNKLSGATRDGRTELDTVFQFLREGDELVVHRSRAAKIEVKRMMRTTRVELVQILAVTASERAF